MKRALSACIAVVALLLSAQVTYAAYLQSGDTVSLSQEQPVKNAYLAGGTITVDTPVENDLLTAGGTISINAPVSGSIMAAGGNITVRSDVRNSIRAAGGNLIIDGPVTNDVVLFGGSLTVTQNASISGDIIVTGGQITIEGPIQGKAIVNGGDILINSSIGGNVEGTVGRLVLGENAVINGDLQYTSEDKAKVEEGAVVRGEHRFTQDERPEKAAKGLSALATAGSFYKLIADILMSLGFVLLLNRFSQKALVTMRSQPLASIGIGFAGLILTPIASLFLLILLWPRLFGFLLYIMGLITAVFFTKLFLGWVVLTWWEKRDKRMYSLDWKAAVVGPILLFILLLVPIVGWLAEFFLFLLALGGILLYVFNQLKLQQGTKTK